MFLEDYISVKEATSTSIMTSNNKMEIEDHCSKTADGRVNEFNKLYLKNMNRYCSIYEHR